MRSKRFSRAHRGPTRTNALLFDPSLKWRVIIDVVKGQTENPNTDRTTEISVPPKTATTTEIKGCQRARTERARRGSQYLQLTVKSHQLLAAVESCPSKAGAPFGSRL